MTDDIPLHRAMFEAEVALSDRYPSLNPFTIRESRMSEFCHILEATKQASKDAKKREKYKNWRPAGDTWF